MIEYIQQKGMYFIMDFKGKTVLVTGSSKGIGASTIIEFAKLGCNVIINYNNSYDEAFYYHNL